MSDSEVLLQAFLEGSSEKLDQLIARHQTEVYTTITCLSASDHEAVLSTVFARLLYEAADFDNSTAVRSALLRYAVQECERRESCEEPRLEVHNTETELNPHESIKLALQRLPVKFAAPFVLRRICGISAQDSAEIMGLSPEMLSARMAVAYRMIRKSAKSFEMGRQPVLAAGQNAATSEVLL